GDRDAVHAAGFDAGADVLGGHVDRTGVVDERTAVLRGGDDAAGRVVKERRGLDADVAGVGDAGVAIERQRHDAFGQAAGVHVDQARVVDAGVAVGGGDQARGAVDVLAVLADVDVAGVCDAGGAAGIAGQGLDACGAVVALGDDVTGVVDRGHPVHGAAGDMDAGAHDGVVVAAGGDRAVVGGVGVAGRLHVDAVGVEAVGVDVAVVGGAGAAAVARGGVDAERIAAGERERPDGAVVDDRGQVLALGLDARRPGGAVGGDAAGPGIGDIDVAAGGEDAVGQRVVGIGVDAAGVGDGDVAAVGIGVNADDVARPGRRHGTIVVDPDVAASVGVDAAGRVGGDVGQAGDADVAGPVGQDAGIARGGNDRARGFIADDEGQVLDREVDGVDEVAVATHDVVDRDGAIAGEGDAAAGEGEGSRRNGERSPYRTRDGRDLRASPALGAAGPDSRSHGPDLLLASVHVIPVCNV